MNPVSEGAWNTSDSEKNLPGFSAFPPKERVNSLIPTSQK
jgi:hypothetical protein